MSHSHYFWRLQAGMIIDDELNNWLVNPLPQGCKLHCIIDACHSGSVMDLPYRSKIKYGQPQWKNEYAGPTSVWKVCLMLSFPMPHGAALQCCVRNHPYMSYIAVSSRRQDWPCMYLARSAGTRFSHCDCHHQMHRVAWRQLLTSAHTWTGYAALLQHVDDQKTWANA